MASHRIEIVEGILSANDRLAEQNRARLDRAKLFSVNIMASPGAGKTSLIEQTAHRLASSLRLAVVEGDLATSLDADRAAAAGARALQINTGGECHLDAVMLQGALASAILKGDAEEASRMYLNLYGTSDITSSADRGLRGTLNKLTGLIRPIVKRSSSEDKTVVKKLLDAFLTKKHLQTLAR